MQIYWRHGLARDAKCQGVSDNNIHWENCEENMDYSLIAPYQAQVTIIKE